MPQITSTPTMPRAPCVHNLEDILDLAGSNVSLDVSALVCSSMVIIVVKAIVVTSILHSVNVPVFSCSLDRQNWMPPIFTVSGTILFWWGSTPFCAALQFMRRMKAVASCICVIEQKHVPPQRNVRLVCDRHVTDKNQSKANHKFMFFFLIQSQVLNNSINQVFTEIGGEKTHVWVSLRPKNEYLPIFPLIDFVEISFFYFVLLA